MATVLHDSYGIRKGEAAANDTVAAILSYSCMRRQAERAPAGALSSEPQ